MFYWWVLADGAERDAKEQQALEQSKAALELAADDASMRRQLYNNLCFYAVEKGDTEALMRYLVLFEGELASESVDQWPPNFIDTVLAAHSAIGFDPERLTYWSGLADALESSRVRQSDQAAVKRHVKEARAKLAALQSSSALN